MQENLEFITVTKEQEAMRLDVLLSSHYQDFSRSYFQYLIDEKAVLVNDKPVKKSCKLSCGDEIQLQFILTKEIALTPENIPLDVLYEDAHVIAINKPAGLVVHPAPAHTSHTFVNALLYHCKTIEQDDTLRPGIVHRLDKDTSGVLIAAKTRKAHASLVEQFSQRQVKKRYIAICQGRPKESIIDQPIGRHPVHRKMMHVTPSGRYARTHLQVIAHNHEMSVVDIDLETGRTHQIRAHFKYIGHPLVGDALYGNTSFSERFGIERQMLHAYELECLHPETKEPLVIKAELAEDIRKMARVVSDESSSATSHIFSSNSR